MGGDRRNVPVVMRGPEDTSAIASASFDEFVGASPEYAAALRDVENAVWNQTLVSPSILELCRLRIAQILGCTVALEHRTPQALADRFDEALADSLTSWPTSGCFDRRMRACLAYAEQLLVDAQEVSDELCSAVIDEIGEGGFLVLTYACGLFETTQRARLVLGAARW
jgi:alkylhydroperoxidase family enzyme